MLADYFSCTPFHETSQDLTNTPQLLHSKDNLSISIETEHVNLLATDERQHPHNFQSKEKESSNNYKNLHNLQKPNQTLDPLLEISYETIK